MNRHFGLIAASLLFAATAASAQSTADARAFVTGLYRGYQAGVDPDHLGKGAPQVFSPRLLTLLRQDQARAPEGEAGAIDWDPVCDCQDYEGLTELAVSVGAAAKGRARADVRFRLGEKARALRFELVSVQGRWRVDDIGSAGTPSVANLLLKAR